MIGAGDRSLLLLMSQEHPDIPAFRAELLDAIRHQEGKLTWYQLRHVLARRPAGQ